MSAPARRRLMLVIPALGHGGAESQLAHLAEGLARRGDDVTLVCLRRAEAHAATLGALGVRLVELGAFTPPAKVAAIPRLRRLARDADLVHCGLFDASLHGRVAAILARRPVTVAEHSADRSMQMSASGRPRARAIALHHRLLAPFTAATVACATAQLELLRREGVSPARLALIPNGVPVEATRRAAADSGLDRAALGVPAAARLLVHVGRLTPEKDQRATVDAVAALRERLGEVHVLFVGDGSDDSARRRARELDAGWAHFLGDRHDVPALLALADLAVLPSRIEALPMVVLEAMAVGVAQVVSDVGDLAPVVAGSGSGLSVPAGDQRAFVDACHRLLSDDAERAAMAARAAAAAWRWDVAPMVERYSELLDAVLAGAPLPAGSSPASA